MLSFLNLYLNWQTLTSPIYYKQFRPMQAISKYLASRIIFIFVFIEAPRSLLEVG